MGTNTGSCSVQGIVSQVTDIQLGNNTFYSYSIMSFFMYF